jgi:hypothetical protein
MAIHSLTHNASFHLCRLLPRISRAAENPKPNVTIITYKLPPKTKMSELLKN